MIEIIPAVLPADFQEIEDKTGLVAGSFKTMQIDVCDGKFVPSKTWPYKTNGGYEFDDILNGDIGMPNWKEIDFEVDLMTLDPDKQIPLFMGLGVSRAIVHARSTNRENLEAIFDEYGKKEYPGTFDIEIGLAIKAHESLDEFDSIIKKAHFVQVMGIEQIGFQGQPQDAGIYEQIKNLKSRYSEIVISVDGGVNLNTAPKLIEAGVNRLVVGSALFGASNVFDTVELFKKLEE
jgi:ribulose-phosphate 3-epimerase